MSKHASTSTPVYRLPLLLASGLVVWLLAGPSLAQDTKAAEDEKSRWSFSTTVGYEYDDNVTVSETDTTSNLSDKAVLFDVAVAYQLYDGPELGLEIGYDFSQSFHEDLSTFDLQSHIISISAEREIMGVDAGLNYLYTRTFLGSNDFLGIHNISPTAGYLVNDHWYVSLRYSYQSKNFINASARDGEQSSGTLDNFIFFLEGKGMLSLGYRVEDENTDGEEFDYLGQFFDARLRLPIPGDFMATLNPTLTLTYGYSKKDYKNITASIGRKREDQLTNVSGSISADITPSLFTTLKVEHIESISNLRSSDYDENIGTISLGLRF